MEKKKTPSKYLEWQKKYDAEKMAMIGIKVPIAEKELFSENAKNQNMKLASFMRRCAKYCIDNNIQLTDSDE